MTEPCAHERYRDGRCTVCGHACEHELILNGACYYCGTTELDPVALSPKPREQIVQIIPAERLLPRKRREPE